MTDADEAVLNALEAPVDDEGAFGPDCLVDVAWEDSPTGWRAGKVVERSPATGLYTLTLEPLPSAEGVPSKPSASSTASSTASSSSSAQTISHVRHSSLRLRCCFRGCLKHALLMQRPPRDCDLCGRALQHPMRSYWEWTADMAETLRVGKSSAQLCASCHKEAAAGSHGGDKVPQPRRGAVVRPGAVVQIGQRQLPLASFTEVPIQRRRQLESEEPEDSEQQNWVECSTCHKWYHWVCALYNQPAHAAAHAKVLAESQQGGGSAQPPPPPPNWHCQACREQGKKEAAAARAAGGAEADGSGSGSGSGGTISQWELDAEVDASRLPETDLSRELQGAVASALGEAGVTCEPVQVRVVSSVDLTAEPKDVMLQRQWSSGEAYPTAFPFRSRALMALQRVEGHDVAFFVMYTQEYGDDCPDPNAKRVYISYVDSVKYLQTEPAGHRSTAYRALIGAYLRSCRSRGFRHVHIWVEPPRAGDEYIFYARPPDERKPMKREKLRGWYVKILERSKAEGTVVRYGDMLDEFRDITSARQIPMFKGDQWEITVPALLEAKEEGDEDEAKEEPPSSSCSATAAGSSSSAAASAISASMASASASASASAAAASSAAASSAANEAGGEGGRSLRLKGVPMCKSVSEDLVAKVRKQMRNMQGHFLVATLAPPEEAPQISLQPQFEPAHSCEVVNTRQAMLHFCQTQALQFNSLRYAQFSTMRLIQEMVRPAANADDGGAAYCLVDCLRGRADDGSMMIACDVCDNWFHAACLAKFLGGVPESDDDSFVCPLCVDSKADAYLSDLGLGGLDQDFMEAA